jgi:arylsulfatase A-like enzyme
MHKFLPVILLLGWFGIPGDVEARPPNVVFILADDLGGHDLGCYGSTFHCSPHLDALAQRGTLFTNAYSASPLCSPTRCSILTGLFPARVGITAPVCHDANVVLEKGLSPAGPNARLQIAKSLTRLKTDYVTLPEVLHQAGYRTGHFGKWHLGAEPYSPLQQGFEVDLPHTAGPGPGGPKGYFAPWPWWKDAGQPEEHIDDRMGDEAAKFIAAHAEQPFFLNYWAFGVHSPWMGKAEYIEEAATRADPQSAQRNPIYAAMIRSLDDSVGKILTALDEHHLTDNTIIIFTSDNGGWHNVAKNLTQHSNYAGIPVTSNAPFRSGKASNYEGGTHVPLLVSWPGHTAPGSRNDTIIHSCDYFPTLLEILGLPTPPGVTFDGQAMTRAFAGETLDRGPIFSHFPHGGPNQIDGFRPGSWVRDGDWKLIRFYADNADGSDLLELYHLRDDPSESQNLASQHLERTHTMNGWITDFLSRTEAVVPRLNPNYNPAPNRNPKKS